MVLTLVIVISFKMLIVTTVNLFSDWRLKYCSLH